MGRDRLLLGLRAMEREAGFCMALWSQVKFLGNGLLNECIGSKAQCFLKKMFHCCQKVAVTDDLARSSIKFIFPLPKTYSSIITCRKSRYIADMAAKSLHRMLLQEAPIPSSDSRMPARETDRATILKQTFDFHNLTPDIRHYIYRRVLTQLSNQINLFRTKDSPTSNALLLRVCKQIHGESRTILYCENEFIMNESQGPGTASNMHRKVGDINLSLIKRIQIIHSQSVPPIPGYWAMHSLVKHTARVDVLGLMTGLRGIKIQFSFTIFRWSL